jgi:aminodeoxyfutalosine deaminase
MASSKRFAELHIHLEGCLDAEILGKISPDLDGELIRSQLTFDSFAGFLGSFKFAVMQLKGVDEYRLLARHAFARLAAEGVVYAEVTHSAGVCLWRKQDAAAIAKALIEEGERAPLRVRWIFDAVRQFGAEHIEATARFTAGFAGSSVLGFGVGGDEAGCQGRDLERAFGLARAAGLKLTPHAGETSDAENVWEVFRLGVDRIGHGIRAVDDAVLVKALADSRTPLEVSIGSNVQTGAVGALEEHPVRRLFEAGVPIILNTDDPGLFRTSLVQEFQLAEKLGFTEMELEELRLNGFRYAFDAASMPESV